MSDHIHKHPCKTPPSLVQIYRNFSQIIDNRYIVDAIFLVAGVRMLSYVPTRRAYSYVAFPSIVS